MFITPIKETVTIMGEVIPIVIDNHKLDSNGADGLYEDEIIYLRDEYLSSREYRRVYGHECFHALCDILGIQLDIHAEETLAHRVSKMFAYEL